MKNNDFELIVFDAEDDEGYAFYKGNKYYFTNAEKKINIEYQLECKLSDYGTIIKETIHKINELRDKKMGKTGQLNNVNELSEILCYAMTAYDHCNKEKYK